ncbi:hypothetical protein G6011_00210 [Alternaria panax]|uniref:Uncharacterized protein n=1 Tax=Alternaria panax TaxID=48097 RepID=A0AAD4II65_9PLEO|nr:hypothetical protein G6011_00210 [Alternaria panax]
MANGSTITDPAAYMPPLDRRTAQVLTTSPASYNPENDRSLSTPTAIGIGVAIGIVGTTFILITVLLLYRAWRLRRPQPSTRYRQAKLWKGFEPVTPSTARTTFVGTRMTNIYLTELPTPVTPAFLMSPSIQGGEEHRNETMERRYSEPA